MKKETAIRLMIYGAMTAAVIIMHNIIINIYPHISL